MNEDKLLGLQMQVRQNQQELLNYVKELDGWGDEMKVKEERLKQEIPSCSEVLSLLAYSVLLIYACLLQQCHHNSNWLICYRKCYCQCCTH